MERSTVRNVQAIERVFSILRGMAGFGGQATVGEVVNATGLPKSTVSRLLASLQQVGVIERLDGEGSYAIGPGLAALTGNVSVVGAVREFVRPHLRDLVQETGEAAGLAVPDGPSNLLYTDHIESPGPVLTRDWTGARFPFHTVAAGYAIMSTWPNEQIAIYVSPGIERFTSTTETTLDGVLKRVDIARRLGYAWTIQDFSEEINGVGAPIIDSEGRALGAISVYGPSYRFPGDADAGRIGTLVREHAAAASRQTRGG